MKEADDAMLTYKVLGLINNFLIVIRGQVLRSFKQRKLDEMIDLFRSLTVVLVISLLTYYILYSFSLPEDMISLFASIHSGGRKS